MLGNLLERVRDLDNDNTAWLVDVRGIVRRKVGWRRTLGCPWVRAAIRLVSWLLALKRSALNIESQTVARLTVVAKAF